MMQCEVVTHQVNCLLSIFSKDLKCRSVLFTKESRLASFFVIQLVLRHCSLLVLLLVLALLFSVAMATVVMIVMLDDSRFVSSCSFSKALTLPV